jgi:hypothetical protein
LPWYLGIKLLDSADLYSWGAAVGQSGFGGCAENPFFQGNKTALEMIRDYSGQIAKLAAQSAR